MLARDNSSKMKSKQNQPKQLESFLESDEEEAVDERSIDKLFTNYKNSEQNDVERKRFIENAENQDCLICIGSIRAKDRIYSCPSCYCGFHLMCIQKWANDSLKLKKMKLEDQPNGYYENGVFVKLKKIEVIWNCPNCRKEDKDIPRSYICYCGRELDPPYQPFLIPHSCGEPCNKRLETCKNHRCLLLCHPGKCPPCPQTITISCDCGKLPAKPIRCTKQSWRCDTKCGKTLSCSQHKCDGICHKECPACNKNSLKRCDCGVEQKQLKCDQSWKCKKTCGKKLECQVHCCQRKCHNDECGECPTGLERSCFCGKNTSFVNSCEEKLEESCGDTCFKPLSCGNESHICLMRCHKGPCGTCKEMVNKKCRCGQTVKVYQCSKELTCETKCKRYKDCKKHVCNRKCCDQCQPCDAICSKTLKCGKHKCGALCHGGNCYPCREKQIMRCRCNYTKTVMCGKKAKIRCNQKCSFTSKCRHPTPPHSCHPGPCPKCTQRCAVPLLCSHECLSQCHDYVKIVLKDETFKPKLPGEQQEELIEMRKLPHPPCSYPVETWCRGGHELSSMPCHEAKSLSCGRKCGRQLICGNHQCQLVCHAVENRETGEQDENCEECSSPCSFERPEGCTHPCVKKCHPNACKKCHVLIKTKCFCGLTEVFYKCYEINKNGFREKEKNEMLDALRSCPGRCFKNFECGHQCNSKCHKGQCPGANDCMKKVKIPCQCKNRKVDFTCKASRNIISAPCDDSCKTKKQQLEQEKELAEQKQKEIELERNMKELVEFEKKFGKKKYKVRAKNNLKQEEKGNWKLKSTVISISFAALVFFAAKVLKDYF